VKVDRQIRPAHGIRFSISGAYGEVARAYLQVMRNDLHEEPFGLLEERLCGGIRARRRIRHGLGY
jgi:hypothetical protein